MVIALGSAGAVIGWKFSPWIAMLILLAAAVYDAIAVWKLKTMQQMAENFVRLRAFPGFIVPKDEPEKVAMLGGGDTFFITLVAVSFFKTSVPMGVLAAAGMTIAVLLLFVFSEKGKSYPALPYIVAGLLASIATWLIM
jgi:presenilin-like A22 family membrane protease